MIFDLQFLQQTAHRRSVSKGRDGFEGFLMERLPLQPGTGLDGAVFCGGNRSGPGLRSR